MRLSFPTSGKNGVLSFSFLKSNFLLGVQVSFRVRLAQNLSGGLPGLSSLSEDQATLEQGICGCHPVGVQRDHTWGPHDHCPWVTLADKVGSSPHLRRVNARTQGKKVRAVQRRQGDTVLEISGEATSPYIPQGKEWGEPRELVCAQSKLWRAF